MSQNNTGFLTNPMFKSDIYTKMHIMQALMLANEIALHHKNIIINIVTLANEIVLRHKNIIINLSTVQAAFFCVILVQL